MPNSLFMCTSYDVNLRSKGYVTMPLTVLSKRPVPIQLLKKILLSNNGQDSSHKLYMIHSILVVHPVLINMTLLYLATFSA